MGERAGSVRREARRILIAGGAGFVGSHLAARLVAEGHEVICLDNLQTGRLSNLAPLMRESRFSFVRHDIVQPVSIEGPLDEIWNLPEGEHKRPKGWVDPARTWTTTQKKLPSGDGKEGGLFHLLFGVKVPIN